jgi:hypothetical protein
MPRALSLTGFPHHVMRKWLFPLAALRGSLLDAHLGERQRGGSGTVLQKLSAFALIQCR